MPGNCKWQQLHILWVCQLKMGLVHCEVQGILYTDISYHLPIYHCLGTNQPDEKETFIIKRIITEHNKNNFLEEIEEVSWENILSSKDTTAALTDLSEIIGKLYNEYFPLRETKLSYNNRISWLTDGMKQ